MVWQQQSSYLISNKKKVHTNLLHCCRLETRGRPLAATNLTLVLGRNNKRKNIRKTCPPERRLFS
ncbi:hypothetical protein PAHAL_9G369000 [Panicum hallii]|uniref:Uncharacterized protein n=1 Tax=Panicum hallii TaxID=206008 RepID=A0A2T8I3R5_9POAL|nr:hypothetical protein PAHAL_9G369000 [Panicum hallii]